MRQVAVLLFALVVVLALTIARAEERSDDDDYAFCKGGVNVYGGTIWSALWCSYIDFSHSAEQAPALFLASRFYNVRALNSSSTTFILEHQHQVSFANPGGGQALMGEETKVGGFFANFTFATGTDYFSPCSIKTILATQGVWANETQPLTAFLSNTDLHVNVSFYEEIHDTTVIPNEWIPLLPLATNSSLPVPKMQYFSVLRANDVKYTVTVSTKYPDSSNLTSECFDTLAYQTMSLAKPGCPEPKILSFAGRPVVNPTFEIEDQLMGHFFATLNFKPGMENEPECYEASFKVEVKDVKDDDDDDGLKGWQIALIVIGSIVGALLAAVVVGAIYVYHKKHVEYERIG